MDKNTERDIYLKGREIDWGKESLTYNEIVHNLKLLNTDNSPDKRVVIEDMYSDKNRYWHSLSHHFNWVTRLFFKQQLEEMYFRGFQRGFRSGGQAMETEYLLEKD